jgi:hypothetical protein
LLQYTLHHPTFIQKYYCQALARFRLPACAVTRMVSQISLLVSANGYSTTVQRTYLAPPTSFGSIDDLGYLENIVNWKLPTPFISRARARTRARASIFSHGLFNCVDKCGHGHEPVPTKILTPLLRGSSRGPSRSPNSNLGGGSPSGCTHFRSALRQANWVHIPLLSTLSAQQQCS